MAVLFVKRAVQTGQYNLSGLLDYINKCYTDSDIN